MSEFIEIPASKNSISNRKPIYGIGINDADYIVTYKNYATKKRITCPYYRRWFDMFRRCYSTKYHIKKPTYIDCTVCDEWLVFSKFKSWMIHQDWHVMELDKDLLFPGNKIYGPEFCIFISQELNTLLVDSAASRGQYPLGVNLHKITGKFVSQCSVNGERKHLGLFDSPELASLAYRRYKSAIIIEISNQYPELKDALLVHADMYLRGEIL